MGYHDSKGRYRRTKTGRLYMPIADFRLLAAIGPIAAFADATTTVPGYATDDSESFGIRWNNDAAPAAVITGGHLPMDRQPGTAMTMKAIVAKTGATLADATTFTSTLFMTALGALRDSDANAGGVSSAVVGDTASKTKQLVSLAVPDTDIPAPEVEADFYLTIKPTAGTLGTDDITIYRLWFEYTQAELSE